MVWFEVEMSPKSEVDVMRYMDDNAISLRWVIDFIYLIMTWMIEDEWIWMTDYVRSLNRLY